MCVVVTPVCINLKQFVFLILSLVFAEAYAKYGTDSKNISIDPSKYPDLSAISHVFEEWDETELKKTKEEK